jgi:hypothetical protein
LLPLATEDAAKDALALEQTVSAWVVKRDENDSIDDSPLSRGLRFCIKRKKDTYRIISVEKRQLVYSAIDILKEKEYNRNILPATYVSETLRSAE